MAGVPTNLIAHIGLATLVLEAVATSVGAGIVVGFVAATGAMLRGRSRKEVESTAFRDGYIGGASGMFCLLWDLLVR